jgi:acetolactate synthase-1/2/3 large subunit
VNGKGTLPEDHPLALGARLNFPSARAWLEAECDVVLAVGTELAESDLWGAPLALGGKLIRVDIDPLQANGNAVAAVAVIGDARAALEAMLDALEERAAARSVGELRERLVAEHAEKAQPWRDWLPALDAALPADAIVAADNAMCSYYGAIGGLPARGPRSFLFPTGFGTLGYAVPAAMGAKLAAPDRPVLALSGDGGLMFTVAELAAAAALGQPIPVVVFVNAGYGEIRNEMQDAGFAPVGTELPPPDLPGVARALGCAGEAVAEPDALPAALAAAFARDVPTVITVPEERR